MAFSHFFFQESESMAESQGYRKNWGFRGGCRPVLVCRLPALSLYRERVPPLIFCMAQIKGVWCHKWCLPVQRRTHKWCHVFQGHTHRGRQHQLHLSPSQPLLSPVLHYGNKYFRFTQTGIWVAPVLLSLSVLLPPSGPWIPHLESEGNDSAFLLGLLSGFLWIEKCKGLHTASATIIPCQLLSWLSRDEGLQTQWFCIASNSE